MAWIEKRGDTYRIRYRLDDGQLATEPGYSTKRTAQRRVNELNAGAEPAPGVSYDQLVAARSASAPKRVDSNPAPDEKPAPAAPSITLFNPFLAPNEPDARRPELIRRALSGACTLEQWVETWIAMQKVSPNTAVTYNALLRTHILPELGHLRLNSLKQLELKVFAIGLVEKGLRPTTVNDVVNLLRLILTAAVDADLIDANPCRRLNLPARKAREKVIADPVQIVRIALRLNPVGAIMFLTAAYTGMRWGELAGLAWDNVHLDAPIPHITVDKERGALHEVAGRLFLGPPKSEASCRQVALSPFLIQQLTALRSRARVETVFTTASGLYLRRSNFARRYLGPAVNGVAKHPDASHRAPISPGLTFHSTRHCQKTWMSEDEVEDYIQNYRLGHATPGVGARYNHKNLQMQVTVADLMEKRYARAVEAHRRRSPVFHGYPSLG